ncbi:MAG: sulfur carrier protein ThiS [Acidobacteriota bacterium]
MTATSIEIVVNGESKTIAAGQTVADLVGLLELDPKRVAVEKNQELVRRVRWAEARVDAGDRIEIVEFVGGG